MKKQRILTPQWDKVLSCLIKTIKSGERIISVCPHGSRGYIVITEYEDEVKG